MTAEYAGISDIDDLVKMRLSFLREDRGFLEDAEAEAIQKSLPGYFRTHLDRDLFVYVVRESQSIVSCAFLLIVEKPMSPAFINGRTGIVLNVYTCPPFRQKGFAGKIIRKLLDDAKEKELSVVELKSTDAGYPLYRAAGFRDDDSKYHPMKWKNSFVNEKLGMRNEK
ncbi:MAG: GNAT family N-acetyltransferase [Flexilinea sp.]|nr:GNAT family N-acetyltransferase [Flexilinea sp.]